MQGIILNGKRDESFSRRLPLTWSKKEKYMKGTVTAKTNRGKKPALDCCHRCGGFMVAERSADTGVVEWHCVACGDRVDQVILAHRQHPELRQEAEGVLRVEDIPV